MNFDDVALLDFAHGSTIENYVSKKLYMEIYLLCY
jgi:hypothetical protein